MADSKKYNGSTWEHSLRKLTTATDTFTTLPVDVYADGNTATVGLKGNTVQSGTPTPDNPIMPEGCGVRTGNLFDKNNQAMYFNRTSLGSGSKWRALSAEETGIVLRIPCLPSTTYTISLRGEYTQSVWNIELTSSDNTPTVNNSVATNTITNTKPVNLITVFTTLADTKYILLQLSSVYINSGGTDNIMLNLGATASPYEPYGYKILISSASTTTSVYLGEVETTRKIKKLVLTGEENIDYYSTAQGSLFRRIIGGTIGQEIYGYAICTHYSVTTVAARANNTLSGNASTINTNLDFIDNRYNSAADFKAYLAAQYANGTPVTVWYALATPETAVVNEPLMKIGDYADTVSGITIPTITGADSFDVLTALKPSEVYLSYTGWHDATVEEWDGSQWNE